MSNFDIVGAALAAGAILSGATISMGEVIASLNERANQLRHADYLLGAHYAALEMFVADAAAPEALSDVVLWLSDASSDRDAACKLVQYVMDDSQPSADGEAVAVLMDELNRLRGHRPDLVELFQKAIGCGLGATLLRWDETATMFSKMAVMSAVAPSSQLAYAARTASYEKQHHHPHDLMGSNGLVPA